jgi:hypothetical protein
MLDTWSSSFTLVLRIRQAYGEESRTNAFQLSFTYWCLSVLDFAPPNLTIVNEGRIC